MTGLRVGTCVLLAAALAAPAPRWLAAQDVETSDSAAAVEADPLTVYLLTAGPGVAVWERFGHDGIWIHDARSDEDVVWEWGVFDFRQEGFYGRLARGTMLYSMQGAYLDSMVRAYGAAGRDVWAQELALTPDQEFELLARVLNNALPGNRDYVYHYYLDNCATRVRDHLDAVLDGAISAATVGDPSGTTWRDHTLRLLRPDPAAWAGVQFVLGRPGDREIDRWDELFLPMKLRAAVATVSVPDGDGGLRPLVVSERKLTRGEGIAVIESAPRWWPIALGLGLLLAGITVAAVRSEGGGARIAGAGLVAWGGVVGLAGTILLAAVLFTNHDFWRWNENLLFASPLTFGWVLVGGGLLLRGAVGERARRVGFALGLLAGLGVVLAILPGGQHTPSTAFVLGSVPVAAAFALRMRNDGRAGG